MLKGWTLWKYMLKRAARAYDIIDPFSFLARLHKFSEPSEVQEPIELLRAGIIFHARGLINTKAIQHNLDWVWPYWVERQFDPGDVSFVPRGFSFSHINLTHRNWTTVGLPNLAIYPIVDPRGLVTPMHDGWSIDLWVISANGDVLLPSRMPTADQHWSGDASPAVVTACETASVRLSSEVSMLPGDNQPVLKVTARGRSASDGWLIAALRPYNPEGVQFIEKIAYNKMSKCLYINDQDKLSFYSKPVRVCLSNYRGGDVYGDLSEKTAINKVHCETGMATGAALFPMAAGKVTEISCAVQLRRPNDDKTILHSDPSESWAETLQSTAKLQVPDARFQELYSAAVRTVIQLTAAEPVPGPYTYNRFWYRDACYIVHALLAINMEERCRKLLRRFPERQKSDGYYHSQNGEWDSNGQVLWLVNTFQRLTGSEIEGPLLQSVFNGAEWIRRKRAATEGDYKGLLPPGFSAEHFGPNDYYYWDDFWSVAGLHGAADLAAKYRPELENELRREATDFFSRIKEIIRKTPAGMSMAGIPASPKRRLDAGAIGSLAADYPLRLFAADEPLIGATAEFLLAHTMHQGGFFQDIIHSGINAYLTLAIAQTLLRRDDDRYRQLVRTTAELATSTGQWPEAIHPQTGGGCMGDGQHGWAAAEWLMMMRNLFVREEEDLLIIGSGIFPEWLEEKGCITFGPTPTPYGPVRIDIDTDDKEIVLRVTGQWRGQIPNLQVKAPGYQAVPLSDTEQEFLLAKDRY